MKSLDQQMYEQLLSHLPKKWLSHFVGEVAQIRWPQKINQMMIQQFAKSYQINVAEAEKSLKDYSSLGDFFTRRLKEGARPIQGDLVHPCDGQLIESGKIHNDRLIQAKGRTYTLSEFLPQNPWGSDFDEGSFYTYYLSPQDYHRVHSPVTGQVQWSVVVPGELWPVNHWSVKNIDQLYAVNERVITGIQTLEGRMILVMVGATNVGQITMSYDPNIKTNKGNTSASVYRDYSEGRPVNVGEEIGVFHLGSTVVALYDKNWSLGYQERRAVQMGQPLNPR